MTAGDDGGVVGAIAEPASSESWTEADAARVLVAVGGPVLWWSLVATIVGLATWSTLERLTWYVANMQIGLLTFAHDLTQGSVFHHAPALDALRELLPSRTDALSQTYVWEDGRLHSRYAPGYPLLLAVGMAVAGPSAAHYVNVVIFAALLVLLVALGSRLLGSRWLGAAVPALVMLFPSRTRWWAQTPTMDLAAHGFALLGLYLVLGVRGRLPSLARAAGAGLALGYAVSIRPDAVLYLLPAMALAVFQWRRERWRRPAKLAAVALAGLLIGMGPFLGYNWLATGSPLRPTQGMELEAFWQTSTATDGSSPVPASPVRRVRLWRGTTVTQVQGGGLRFVNLPKVLPDQLGQVRRIYGDVLLGAAILGALLSLAVRPRLFLVTVPYVLVALPFFSCWSRRDQRLLIGVDLLLPLLVLQGTIGTLDLVRRLVNDGRTMRRRVVALLLAVAWVGVAWVGWRWMPERSVDVMLAAWTVPALTGTLLLGTIAALAFSCALSTHEARAMAAALVLVGLVVMIVRQPDLYRKAPFQHPQVEQARRTFSAAVGPAAVVITSEDLGRPAENIEWWAGVPAVYLTDLERWRISAARASAAYLASGRQPYLLIGDPEPGASELIADLSSDFRVDRVVTIPSSRKMEYFVASPRASSGAVQLYRITPK